MADNDKTKDAPNPDAPAAGAPAPAPAADQQELIWVVGTGRANSNGGFPMALFERNENHPGGEAFIAGPTAVLVAPTSSVLAKIQSGEIRKANRDEIAAGKEAADKAAQPVGGV
jgi:hypothetical protein